MLQINVKDGTPRSDLPDLCKGCRWGLIAKTDANVDIRQCTRFDRNIKLPGVITQCTGYSDKHELTLHEMSQISWDLKTDKHGQIGFIQKEKTGGYDSMTFPDKAAKFGDSI